MLRHTAGVPRARLPVRRRPVASSWPGCPARTIAQPDRRRRRTCSPTSTRRSCSSRRPAGPTPRSSTGSASGSPRSARTASRITGRELEPIEVPVAQEIARRRPDRRRRRLPGRLLRRAVLGPGAGAGRPGRLAARRRWCWRPSAPRSTRSRPTSSSSASPSPTATPPPTRSARTCPPEPSLSSVVGTGVQLPL